MLPTGLNVREYAVRRDHGAENGTVRLVWIGSASTLSYLASIRGALEEIGRRHGKVVLRIIADDFFELANMPVERCIWSLESQAPDLAAGHIGLAPLPDDRFARGKCGFKILQYAATGIPFIANSVGVNSIFTAESGAGLMVNSQEDWVAKLSILIENENLRSKLGHNGRQYAERFDAKIIASRLVSVLKATSQSEQ
jgi:glycosyltransferase involved in cell wall biosynthesis